MSVRRGPGFEFHIVEIVQRAGGSQALGSERGPVKAAALGPDTDDDVVESLEMLYSGALVRAGMGYASYEDIARRLEKSARLMLR